MPSTFTYTSNAKHTAEGMIAGSQAIMRNTFQVVWTGMGIVFAMLMGLGGAALATLICLWAQVESQWWMLAGFVLAGFGYILHQNLLLKAMARALQGDPFNQGPQTVTLDENALVFEAAGATWRTPWATVSNVRETKSSVTLLVGGISFPIPKTEIGDADAIAALIASTEERISRARSNG